MQVESRGNLFTMPRRRRFKPRIDCAAILGKLSSAIVRWLCIVCICHGEDLAILQGFGRLAREMVKLQKKDDGYYLTFSGIVLKKI